MDKNEIRIIINELLDETHGKLDGGRKNIIADCPWCGKKGKFGIRIKADQGNRKQFSSHCFSCGRSTRTIEELCDLLNRPDLKPHRNIREDIEMQDDSEADELEEELDDSLVEVQMPEGYKRTTKNRYLKSRGFINKDYTYFEVGTTRGLNFKFDAYIIIPIIEDGKYVGYVARHTWSKDEIDTYNQKQALVGGYQIRRYSNSCGEGSNEFSKLLYNYDNVIEDETDTVVLCEGVFDVIALTRHFDLYNYHRIVPVATFGKKISEIQAYKLQAKGVRTIVIGYDNDAEESINRTADFLLDYFDVYIATLEGEGKDYDEADFWDVFDAFSKGLKTPFEYKNIL